MRATKLQRCSLNDLYRGAKLCDSLADLCTTTYLFTLKTFVEKALFTLISAVFVVFIVVCQCPYSFSDRPTLLIPLLKGPVSQM